MPSRSRWARLVTLTRHATLPEHFQSFPRGTHSAFLDVLYALADSFERVCVRGNIQERLIGLGILNHHLRLSIDSQDQRFFGFFRRFMNFPGLRRKVIIA
jgi:hypothetical protein